MEGIPKTCDHTEVATATTYCPEQVGILMLVDDYRVALGGNDLCGE